MLNKPIISALIPTYKRPQMLKKAVESVLAQSYPHLKVCVFDDFSNDETKEICLALNEKDHRVSYFCHSENRGMARNFEYALSQVTTPYFSFVNDDDLLLPKFYERAINAFETYNEIAIFGGGSYVKMGGKTVDYAGPVSDIYYEKGECLNHLIQENFPFWLSMVFKKEKVNGVEIDPSVPCFDSHYVAQIAAKQPVFLVKQPVSVFFTHNLSFSTNVDKSYFWKGWEKIISEIREKTKVELDQKSLFRICILAIKYRSFSFAIQESVHLICSGWKFRGYLCLFAAKACKNYGLIYRMFVFLVNARKAIMGSFKKWKLG